MEKEKSDTFHPYSRFQTINSRLPFWYSPIGSFTSETMLDLYVPKGTIIESYTGN
jgi:hypothetical protein